MQNAHAALAERGLPLASNQVEYNLLYRQIERDGILEAADRNYDFLTVDILKGT